MNADSLPLYQWKPSVFSFANLGPFTLNDDYEPIRNHA